MNEHQGLNFKSGEFEGHLDLLLDLIERRKLHINDVSLASITEEYIERVSARKELPTGEVAHFVLIASTLLLIKSKSLLPHLSLTTEEESDVKNLEERLKFLEKIRSLSPHLKERLFVTPMYLGGLKRSSRIVFSPSGDLSLSSLSVAIRSAIQSLPLVEKLPKAIVEKIISLEEMMENLAKRIEKSFSMSFKEFSKAHANEKKSVIVGFLALLELVKQGVLSVAQKEHFDDIHIQKDSVGIPEYN